MTLTHYILFSDNSLQCWSLFFFQEQALIEFHFPRIFCPWFWFCNWTFYTLTMISQCLIIWFTRVLLIFVLNLSFLLLFIYLIHSCSLFVFNLIFKALFSSISDLRTLSSATFLIKFLNSLISAAFLFIHWFNQWTWCCV